MEDYQVFIINKEQFEEYKLRSILPCFDRHIVIFFSVEQYKSVFNYVNLN